MAAPPITLLEKRYRALKEERGPEKPRGWHADEIAAEFVAAVDAFEPVFVGTGQFYPDGQRELLPDPTIVLLQDRIKSTDELASILAARPRFKVDRRPQLDFHYVDREIVASRALDAAGKPHYQASPVQLDLLLVNANDATPIASEAKLTADPKDPEAALLQALLYASLLAPSGQRSRLPMAYPDLFRLGTPAKIDVYVLLYRLAKRREPLLESAIALAKDLGKSGAVAKHLRHIAFIEMYVRQGRPRFRAMTAPINL
jgi:hypothetical protein